LNNLKEEPFCI